MGQDRDSSRCDGLIVQDEKLIGAQSKLGVGSALIVAKFNLEDVCCQNLDDCADLSAHEPMGGHIFRQSHDVKQLD